MGKLKAFVSCSFDKEDFSRDPDNDDCVVNRFLKLFSRDEFGLDVRTARPWEPARVIEKITKKIDPADVVIGILTRKDQINDRSWIPSRYVIGELNYAFGRVGILNRPKIVMFVEDGVSPAEAGLPSLEGIEHVLFSRDRFDEEIPRFEEVLRQLNPAAERPIIRELPSYRFERFKKIVKVFNDGRGLIDHEFEAQVLDEKIFRGFPHYVQLVNTSERFPTWPELLSNPASERFEKPFLKYTLLDSNNPKIDKIQKIKPKRLSHSDDKRINFKILQLDQREKHFIKIKSYDRFHYQYVWGAPNMHAVSSADLGSARFPNSYSSCFLELQDGPIDQLELEIWFEEPFKFAKNPFIVFAPTLRQLDDNPVELLKGGKSMNFDSIEFMSLWKIYRVNLGKYAGVVVVYWLPD